MEISYRNNKIKRKGNDSVMLRSHSYIATPPGATIKEQLMDRGMSQKEFAARMDLPEKHISKLINSVMKKKNVR